MVCTHCGSQSHHTGHSACANYCKEPGHRQKRAECKFRVCSKCGGSGHSATECTQTGCSECGSTTHKSALSFACPGLPQVHQLQRHARTEGPQPKRLPSNAWMQRMRQHDSQKRFELRVSRTQVHQLQRHARTRVRVSLSFST